VIQLASLPVLAWIVLRTPPAERHFSTWIELPVEPRYPPEEDEFDALPAPDEPLAEPRLIESDAADPLATAAASRAAEARRLRALTLPNAAGPAPLDETAHLLWARARQLETGLVADELLREPPRSATAAELALRLELLLDRWALRGESPAQVGELVGELTARRDAPRLAHLAVLRAQSYGVVARATAATLSWGEPPRRDAGALPLDEAWAKALAEVGSRAGFQADGDAARRAERELWIERWSALAR
jgi:hypothetical protein